jgi:hypothetical protein
VNSEDLDRLRRILETLGEGLDGDSLDSGDEASHIEGTANGGDDVR